MMRLQLEQFHRPLEFGGCYRRDLVAQIESSLLVNPSGLGLRRVYSIISRVIIRSHPSDRYWYSWWYLSRPRKKWNWGGCGQRGQVFSGFRERFLEILFRPLIIPKVSTVVILLETSSRIRLEIIHRTFLPQNQIRWDFMRWFGGTTAYFGRTLLFESRRLHYCSQFIISSSTDVIMYDFMWKPEIEQWPARGVSQDTTVRIHAEKDDSVCRARVP